MGIPVLRGRPSAGRTAWTARACSGERVVRKEILAGRRPDRSSDSRRLGRSEANRNRRRGWRYPTQRADRRAPADGLPGPVTGPRLLHLHRRPHVGESETDGLAIRREVRQVDPGQPVAGVQPMEQYVSTALARPRLYAVLLGAFASLALLLAAVGLYGLMAYAASRRTHEIGIRMALGAQPRDVLRSILSEGARLAAAGLALGAVCAVAFQPCHLEPAVWSDRGRSVDFCGRRGVARCRGADRRVPPCSPCFRSRPYSGVAV